jgi:anti-sigma28 factor (negative regulator of flagellin synthesis)
LETGRQIEWQREKHMQIYGPAHLHGPQSVNNPHAARLTQPNTAARPSADPADTLEISSAGAAASRLADIPDIRYERVAALKAQIQAGTYETVDKLDGALEALLDEIG